MTSSYPKAPGVYLMKNSQGVVLYVGKAKNLKHRIAQYFSREAEQRYQIKFLMRRVSDIDVVVTDTEKEALLLENTLIKKHKPRYNIQLRDDKSYLSLKLSIQDKFPRLTITRSIKKDGSQYFGPYASATACRDVLDFIEHNFCLRTCSDRELQNRARPCLQYQIQRCDAPCVGLIDSDQYRDIVDDVKLFLSGKNKELQKILMQKMEALSTAEEFEKAAHYRDLLGKIEQTLEKQRVVKHHGQDRDFIVLYHNGQKGIVSVMTMRNGNIVGTCHYYLQGYLKEVFDANEVLEQFLLQYYAEERDIPKNISLNISLASLKLITECLMEKKGEGVFLDVPRRGDRFRMIQLVLKNADLEWRRRLKKDVEEEEILAELQKKIGLKNLPRRMECFDISNIQGKSAVGSSVLFVDGKPSKSGSRHYRIRGCDGHQHLHGAQVRLKRRRRVARCEGSNDFLMMREVLMRRFASKKEETKKSVLEFPDLLVVDGGKGQLAQAVRIFEEFGLQKIDMIGLAKKAEGEKQDKIFIPGRKNAIVLPPKSLSLLLLMQIRDEAHRFAVSYHRKLHNQRLQHSQLDQIKGISQVRRNALLRYFGSLDKIREASLEDLLKVPHLQRSIAERLYHQLHS